MFRGARLKLDRSNKHIGELQTIIGSLESHYVASVEVDQATGAKSIKYECPEFANFLTEIALASGDAVHNLRSALDHAWVSAVDSLGLANTRWTKFPFCKDSQSLDNVLSERGIPSACPALLKWLRTDVKPYPGGNDLLCALHDVDILDKHKLLVPVLDCTGAIGLRLEDERGEVEASVMPRYGTNGIIYVDFFPNVQIKDKGQVSVAVFFDKGTPLGTVPIPGIFDYLRSSVLKVITHLENTLWSAKKPCGAKQPPVPADNRDAVRQALASI
jgi:hypothetical protein